MCINGNYDWLKINIPPIKWKSSKIQKISLCLVHSQINTISVEKYFYEYGLNKFLEKYPQEKDYVTREQIADLLGKDSKEYEKIISLLSWIYDVYDKQLKDSSDA